MSCAQYCPDTLTIESFYSRKDCLGNDFAAGFSNRMRIQGMFYYLRQEQETQERGQSQFIYDRRVREIWKLVLTRPLRDGSYGLTRLIRSVLLGRNITVRTSEGEFGGFLFKGSIDKNPDTGIVKDWFISVELEREVCRLNDNC